MIKYPEPKWTDWFKEPQKLDASVIENELHRINHMPLLVDRIEAFEKLSVFVRRYLRIVFAQGIFIFFAISAIIAFFFNAFMGSV